MTAAPELLVCVYYRVAAADSRRAIDGVREFQRTLAASVGATQAQVLLRCDLPPAAASSDDRTAPLPSPATPARVAPCADPDADATVMETYRLPLPAPVASAAADAVVRAFLHAREAAAQPLAGLLRGARHVELFSPCAS